KARARFDRQLVEGEVARAQAQRLRQRCRPAVLRVAGHRVDQVEADAAEIPLRGFKRAEPLARIVGAAEEGERLAVEALQPERESIDPRRGEIGKARRLYRVGIRLERD